MSRGWLQPAVAGLGGAIVIYCAAGASLNLLLGATAYTAALTPAVAQQYPLNRWGAATALAAGVSIGWLVAVVGHAISLPQWLAAAAVLASVVAVELAAGELLESIRVPAPSAGAIVLLAATAWGTWPIWGSLRLTDAGAPHTVAVHPLFALNGIAPTLGIWSEQPIPYRLSAFGQNVVYRLPTTVFPCIALHGGLAVVMHVTARRLVR